MERINQWNDDRRDSDFVSNGIQIIFAIKTRLTCTLHKLRYKRVTAIDQRPDYR